MAEAPLELIVLETYSKARILSWITSPHVLLWLHLAKCIPSIGNCFRNSKVQGIRPSPKLLDNKGDISRQGTSPPCRMQVGNATLNRSDLFLGSVITNASSDELPLSWSVTGSKGYYSFPALPVSGVRNILTLRCSCKMTYSSAYF